MRRLAFALLAAAPALLGQGSSGPLLGFVPGATAAELQPIWGIPGAARLGDALPVPNTVTQLYLAPGHTYALGAQGTANPVALLLLRLAPGKEVSPTLNMLPGAITDPDLVAFSPTGCSAVLYSEGASRLQVFTGLPNSPQIVLNIQNMPVVGHLKKLALSDDARVLLLANDDGTAYAVSQNSAPVAVFHTSQVAALAFVSRSHDAVVVDPVQGSVTILKAFTATAEVRMLLPSSILNGCQPQAAASSADGSTILIGCPAQHVVLSIDHLSGAVNGYKTTNSTFAFDPLAARDTFLMSPPDGGTYWLFRWQPSGPVIYFVGAARHPGQGSSN